MDLAPKSRIKHVKRGSGYTFLGLSTFQADTEVHKDYDVMAVYLSDDGLLVTRPISELVEGNRFVDGDPTLDVLTQVLDRIDEIASSDDETPESRLSRIRDLVARQAKPLAARSVLLSDNAMIAGPGAFDRVEAMNPKE